MVSDATPSADETLVVGELAGAHGVRGWVKLKSFTDPAENLVHYANWRLLLPGPGAATGSREVRLAEWRWHSERLIGRLEGIADRDAAAALTGAQVTVPRSELPAPSDGWYWADLMGYEVHNLEGVVLGRLRDVMDNGAQDIMVVAGTRERLIPFVRGPVVHGVEEAQRRILVDWGEDY